MSDTSSTFTSRALDWLRAGYPTGVPRGDYVALLGLLRRKLTEDEVRQIAHHLTSSVAIGEEITTVDIERLVNETTLGQPSEEDIVRVSSHLAAGGWPLAEAPGFDRS